MNRSKEKRGQIYLFAPTRFWPKSFAHIRPSNSDTFYVLLFSERRPHIVLTNSPQKTVLSSGVSSLLPLFMLVRFQVRMLLLLFRRNPLSFIRGAIFVFSFGARLDTHSRFLLLHWLLNNFYLVQLLTPVKNEAKVRYRPR